MTISRPAESQKTTGIGLDVLAADASQLYSLPAVAVDVLELTSNPTVDARALKNCIERDPALTSKILRVVNSSLFGLSGEVHDLNQALALLGTKPLKLLVLGFSLPQRLFEAVDGEVLSRYWRRALTRAVAARLLAQRLSPSHGDEAFLAALLRDVSVLVLVKALGNSYVTLRAKTTVDGGDFEAVQRAALGFDHLHLTARLLRSWGLPKSLSDAATVRSEPVEDPPPASTVDGSPALQGTSIEGTSLAQSPDRHVPPARTPAAASAVLLADLLAGSLVDQRPGAMAAFLRSAEEHHIDKQQVDQLLAELHEALPPLAAVFSLEMPEGHDALNILAAAQALLSAAAEEAVPDVVRAQRARRDADEDSLLGETRALAGAMAGYVASARPMQQPRRTPASERENSARAEPASHVSAPWAEPLDPTIAQSLAVLVDRCRRDRCALSLVLIELDRYGDVAFRYGPAAAETLLGAIFTMCRSIEHAGAVCLPFRDAQFAVALADCDRREAVQIADDLVRRVGGISGARRIGEFKITVSAAAATVSMPPKNFSVDDMIDRAERCLYAARTSGGGCVKSIEIY